MRRIILLGGLLAGVLAPFHPATAETTVFLGRATANVYSGVAVACPDGDICLDTTWYRWTLKVERKLTGPDLPRIIVAARLQHAGLVPRYMKTFRVFVVTPIKAPEQRRLLRADYILDDQSGPLTLHCFDTDPSKFGLDVDDVYVNKSGRYCFELHNEH